MTRLLTLLALLAAPLSLHADDNPDRAAQLKTLRADFETAQADFRAAIKAGTVKPDDVGDYPGWAELPTRFLKPTRAIIEAGPADALGLEALLFALGDLGATDTDLFALALKHHAASDKLDSLLGRQSVPVQFLRELAAESPHPKLRLRSQFFVADRAYDAGELADAIKSLENLERDPALKAIPVSENGQLPDRVTQLLYEARHLNVGQVAPAVAGDDLDGKPLKLSDSRGKATLLVFWSTDCRPCMGMVRHEVELVERYAGRPFAIVGVNGDILAGGNFVVLGRDGKPVDGTAKLKVLVEKNKITWRSFRHGHWGSGDETGIGYQWNVHT